MFSIKLSLQPFDFITGSILFLKGVVSEAEEFITRTELVVME